MNSENKLDEKNIVVTFLPQGRKVTTFELANLQEVITHANIGVAFLCAGKGICGKCKVKIRGTINNPTHQEKKSIMQELKQGYRLACQVILKGDAQVEIPDSSLISNIQSLPLDLANNFEVKSSVEKIYLHLNPPTLEDQRSDISRLKKGLAEKGYEHVDVDIDVIKQVPLVLRASNFRVTCTVDGGKLIAIEKGDTSAKKFGLAFDIGTTTLVGTLVNLHNGERIATESALNPQSSFGFDVISRISYVQQKGAKGLQELQRAVINTINELIANLTKRTNVNKHNIYRVTLAGNTVMQHLVAGISPLNLGLYPFIPVVQNALHLKSSDLKVKVNSSASVYVLPNIAAFIGGDTVGLILATMLHKKSDKIRLAIDIGTNGEIVLARGEKLVAASTAAGPVFEGVRISQGMIAQKGAIEKLELKEGEVFADVIGGEEAQGICGSGLVDLISELYREHIIDDTGRIKPAYQQKKVWARRVVEEKGERKFIFLENKDKPPFFVLQKDIREFQLAKAAISAGITILLKKVGIDRNMVQEFLIAGAFGNRINLASAYRVGLFPVFPHATAKMVGNAASIGAIQVLLSQSAQQEVGMIPACVQHIELANDPDFQKILSDCLFVGTLT